MNNAPEVTVLAGTPAGDVTMVFGEHQGVRLDGDSSAVALLKSHMLRCVNIDGMSISPDTMHPTDVPFLESDGFVFDGGVDDWEGIGTAPLFDGEPMLDGDFAGHPFRGNQYEVASRRSQRASRASRLVRHSERLGQQVRHERAAELHEEAAGDVKEGSKGHQYHRTMADFHRKRAAWADAKRKGKMLDDGTEWPDQLDADPILDGDFAGHPFRGNQHVAGSGASSSAGKASRLTKFNEVNGVAGDSLKTLHRAAGAKHREALAGATGKAVNYHAKMAEFHEGRGTPDPVVPRASAAAVEVPSGDGLDAHKRHDRDHAPKFSKAKYSKGKVLVHAPSTDGFMTRAGRLARSMGGRHTNRERGYVMSPAAAGKLAKKWRDGWDGDAMGGRELTPPKMLDSVGEVDRHWFDPEDEFDGLLDSVETDALHDQIRASTSPSDRIALCRALLAERAKPAPAPVASAASASPDTVPLDTVLVKWVPRFKTSFPPQYQTLSAKHRDAVWGIGLSRYQMLGTDAGVRFEGEYSKTRDDSVRKIAGIKAARAAGYETQRVKDAKGGELRLLLVKDGGALTPDAFERMAGATAEPAAAPAAPPVAASYRYALVNRPPSLGAIPSGLNFTVEPRPARGQPFEGVARHGIMVTDRELTDAELKSFELLRVDPGSTGRVVSRIAEDMREYAESYREMYEGGNETDRREFVHAVHGRAKSLGGLDAVDSTQDIVGMVYDQLKAMGKPAATVAPPAAPDVAQMAADAVKAAGLPLSGWRQSTAKEWRYAETMIGETAVPVGVSTGGIVSFNGDPFTPGRKPNDNPAAVAESLQALVARYTPAPNLPVVSDAAIARALAVGIKARDAMNPAAFRDNQSAQSKVKVEIINYLFREPGIDAIGRSDDLMDAAKAIFARVKAGELLPLQQVMATSAANDWRSTIIKARTLFRAMKDAKLTTTAQDDTAADAWSDLPRLVAVIDEVVASGGNQSATDAPSPSVAPAVTPVPAPTPTQAASADSNGAPMTEPAALFRSVSPEEWAEILASGTIKGGLNTFNAWDKRREVFFALKPTDGVVSQGNEKTRRGEYAVQQGPLQVALAKLTGRYNELDKLITARVVELGALSYDDLDSWVKRKDPVIGPVSGEWNSLSDKIGALQAKARAEINVKLGEIAAQDAARGFTSVLLETRPMDGGRVYSGVHSGMGHEVEIGMDSGAVSLGDVIRITFYNGTKAVRQSTPDQEKGGRESVAPVAPAPAADPAGEASQLQRLDAIKRAAPAEILKSDDPNLIPKLRTKLDYLEAYADLMRTANRHVRNKSVEKGDAGLREMGYSPVMIASLRKPDFAGRIGFADYMMSNNNGEIGRYKRRLEQAMKDRPQDATNTSQAPAPVAPPVAPPAAPVAPSPTPAPAAVDDDQVFLQSIISGTADLMATGIAPKFEEIAGRRGDDASVMALLQQAGEVYTQNAIKAAQEALKKMMG